RPRFGGRAVSTRRGVDFRGVTNMIRRKSISSLISLAVAVTSLGVSGCGQLGNIGGLLGNLGGLGGGGGLLGGLLGGPPSLMPGPLGQILSLAGSAVTSFIQNAPNPIDSEIQGDAWPVSPFKVVVPATLNPQLQGTLLVTLTDQPVAGAMGPDGNLYYTEKVTGKVRRFNPDNPPAVPDTVL